MKFCRSLLAGAMLVVASRTGVAQASPTAPNPREVQPERPTVATHAGTVAPGYLEIEAGVERDQLSHSTSTLLAPIIFKFGVTSHTQLSVSTPFAIPMTVPVLAISRSASNGDCSTLHRSLATSRSSPRSKRRQDRRRAVPAAIPLMHRCS